MSRPRTLWDVILFPSIWERACSAALVALRFAALAFIAGVGFAVGIIVSMWLYTDVL